MPEKNYNHEIKQPEKKKERLFGKALPYPPVQVVTFSVVYSDHDHETKCFFKWQQKLESDRVQISSYHQVTHPLHCGVHPK